MPRNISASWIEKKLTEISDLNIQIHQERVKHAIPFDEKKIKLSNQYCSVSPDRVIIDGQELNITSNHRAANELAMINKRNKLILLFIDHFVANVNIMYSKFTSIKMIFGVTEKASGTIYMEVDKLSIHPRPVSIKYFVSILNKLIKQLEFNRSPIAPLRKFTIFLDGITGVIYAPSQCQAFWKFLCIKRKNIAQEIIESPDPTNYVRDSEFLENFKACYIFEDIHITRTLVQCTLSHTPVPFDFPTFEEDQHILRLVS